MQLTIPVPARQEVLLLPPKLFDWSEEEFFRFCQANRELQIERNAKGEIIVMSPAGGYSGFRSGEAYSQLRNWALQDATGVAFDSCTGFLLPTGGMRSPDAAWVRRSRLEELSHHDKERFLPLCPDFVIEVASRGDTLSGLREKTGEYRRSGLPLGWLILPDTKEVEVYSSGPLRTLNSPESVVADPLLPGFCLELAAIWNPPF
jgi:Uma2 family endonuclease